MSGRKNNKALLGSGLLLALTSSLCCIAPLLAIIGGAGGSMAAFSWAAPLRPYLLGATAIALGLAFYQAYKPAPKEDCCAVPAKKSWLQSKGFLWTVATMTVLLSSFPYYAKYLQAPAPVAKASLPNANHLQQVVLHIEGMGCEDCEGHVNKALQQLPGVHQVNTVYAKGIATVTFDSLQVSFGQLATTVESETGYKVIQKN